MGDQIHHEDASAPSRRSDCEQTLTWVWWKDPKVESWRMESSVGEKDPPLKAVGNMKSCRYGKMARWSLSIEQTFDPHGRRNRHRDSWVNTLVCVVATNSHRVHVVENEPWENVVFEAAFRCDPGESNDIHSAK